MLLALADHIILYLSQELQTFFSFLLPVIQADNCTESEHISLGIVLQCGFREIFIA
jgi:hypothetical protein